jgi:superfamily I DNA and RNA helicase
MAFDYIPTKFDLARSPALDELIATLRNTPDNLGAGEGVIYYGWPKYTDYDAVRHQVDLAILTSRAGIVFVRVLSAPTPQTVAAASESLNQLTASAVSQLIRSPALRTRARQLKVPVNPIIYAPGYDGLGLHDVELAQSQASVLRFIADLVGAPLSAPEYEETRSILEGAKALARPTRRAIADPSQQTAAVALSKLEEEIASFDQKQRSVALTVLGGPHRIRGLAGSGKTVILAMKAALAHLDDPEAKILVTYYTRSLRDQLTRLITRFHRHFGEGEPNWDAIHIRHGWGRKDLPGVYREACLRTGIAPLSFTIASAEAGANGNPMDFACRALLQTGQVAPYYDLILIDEGQDFPDGFYQLCFALAKGSRDRKQIVWAYDELQNVFNVAVRTPEDLFGIDVDGQPRISLARALPPHADTNDFVLSKCYRNQRQILVLAHATGFGVYGEPVQMLQDKAHWEDVGYQVRSPSMVTGADVEIHRPKANNPTSLHSPAGFSLIDIRACQSMSQEAEFVANEFSRFIESGLQPEDLMAIAIDDRRAKSYLSTLASLLSQRGIMTNNIIADRYDEPLFTIPGKVTLTTVYRAKGNEAAVVAVIGCDAVPLKTRSGRNRLFTAFTRTKGWLRITGTGPNFAPLQRELSQALQISPDMKFKMPDMRIIETIQRDLSEKDSKIQRLRAEIERLQEEHGLSEEDVKFILSGASQNGRK